MDIVQSYCSLGQVMLIFITSGSIYQRLFTCPDVKKTPTVLTVSAAWQCSAAIQLGGMAQLMQEQLWQVAYMLNALLCEWLQTKQLGYSVDLY